MAPTSQKIIDDAVVRFHRVADFYRDQIKLPGLADNMLSLADFVSSIPADRGEKGTNQEYRSAMFRGCHGAANSLDRLVAHFPEHYEGSPDAPPELSDEVAVLSPLLRKLALEFKDDAAAE